MSQWVPHMIAAAFIFGVVVGSFLSWGADRVELAAYRRISRRASEKADEIDALLAEVHEIQARSVIPAAYAPPAIGPAPRSGSPRRSRGSG